MPLDLAASVVFLYPSDYSGGQSFPFPISHPCPQRTDLSTILQNSEHPPGSFQGHQLHRTPPDWASMVSRSENQETRAASNLGRIQGQESGERTEREEGPADASKSLLRFACSCGDLQAGNTKDRPRVIHHPEAVSGEALNGAECKARIK